MMTPPPEHPFAKYIRILGKGKNGSRSLTTEESYDAMKMILDEQVEPMQLGAFLIMMRVKEETPEEMAGFITACKEKIPVFDDVNVQLDWSSYAGKKRHLPWFILSALLLSDNGVSVFMHGASGHTAGRLYTEEVLPILGIQPCQSMQEAADQIKQNNFAFAPLSVVSLKLEDIIQYRPILGLRSPVHSIARQLNPFNAPYILQGIFHPGYRPIHQEAALLLKQNNLTVIKGEGGEIERNPDIECLAESVIDGQLVEETWPPVFKRRHVKDSEMDINRLPALWAGELDDEYAIASVVATTAVALKLLGQAGSQDEAMGKAEKLWQQRDKSRYQ
jgi:anthranilate phosphoribosyltransferase